MKPFGHSVIGAPGMSDRYLFRQIGPLSKLSARRQSLHTHGASIIAAILLVGCSAGRYFNITRVHDVQPGVTSIPAAEQLFGKPVSIEELPGGGTQLHWWYIASSLCDSHRTELVILFGPDGRL